MKNMKTAYMTNVKFSENNDIFKVSCSIAGIPATRRQASKFRNNKGLAWKNHPSRKVSKW
jgi:hypothetical protein